MAAQPDFLTRTSGDTHSRRPGIRSNGSRQWSILSVSQRAGTGAVALAKSRRPPCDPVLMSKVPVLQTLYMLSDE
jgi:hypothetical protein